MSGGSGPPVGVWLSRARRGSKGVYRGAEDENRREEGEVVTHK